MKRLITLLLLFNVAKGQTIAVTDYGAIANDGLNDYVAFKKVSDTINARGGFTSVVFAAGTYNIRPPYLDTYPDSVQTASQWDVFSLINCNTITFTGIGTVIIKLMDSVPFGVKPGMAVGDSSVHIGSLFRFEQCRNITITNITGDGNMDGMRLLNPYGVGPNPYEREHEGLFILNVDNLVLENCSFKKYGRDGYLILENQSGIKTKNLFAKNCTFNSNGRDGVSWTGGDNVVFIDCEFNYNSKGRVGSNPGSGLDIEPERGAKCINGKFYNCIFSDNYGYSVVTGHPTDAYNILFDGGNIYNFQNLALFTSTPLVFFKNIKFVGQILTANFPADSANTFYRCSFSDSLPGYIYNHTNYIISVGTNIRFDWCNFIAHNSSILYSENSGGVYNNCVFNALFTSNNGYGALALQTNYATYNSCVFRKSSYADFNAVLLDVSRFNTLNNRSDEVLYFTNPTLRFGFYFRN